jgi:hypothetical protein
MGISESKPDKIIEKYKLTDYEWYDEDGKLHRDNDLPARITFNKNIIFKEEWYLHGLLHRKENKPAIIQYREGTNDILWSEWLLNGARHREDGPAFILYNENGKLIREEWYLNGVRHNVNGPAMIYYNDNGVPIKEEWYFNNLQHRENGPARFLRDEFGNMKVNYWMRNGRFHNSTRPAIVNFDTHGNITSKQYYYEGKRVSNDFIKMNIINELWEREEIDNQFQYLPLEMLNITKQLYKYEK